MTTIAEFKKHVTHFSAELPLKTSIQEEVRMAGKVTMILACPGAGEIEYWLMLDDMVGAFTVLISKDMMDHFAPLICEGSYVIVDGYVNVLTRMIHGKVEKQYSVIAYHIEPFKEGEHE
jgi:hypothetical protein